MSRKPLPKLIAKLRDFQDTSFKQGLDLIESNPQDWHLFTSPTGTGKSYLLLSWLHAIKNSILVTPRVEIIGGMLDKIGHTCETLNDIVNIGQAYGMFTPIRLRNMLAAGTLPFQPQTVLLDECHHQNAESWQDIQMYLNGIPLIGVTASPYRGTPKGTEEFRKMWGTINPCITLEDAVKRGFCAFPTVDIWPLVDDDQIDIVNGEIKISAADILIKSRFHAILAKCKQFYNTAMRLWDRPTMFSLPSSISAKELTRVLNEGGLPTICVTQETKRSDRVRAFELVVQGKCALVQIDVISEGVDLPIRRLIDIKPTMSPVKWIQQIGRIMRPIDADELPPEYICLCRNLERHCYLMEGLVPNSTIKQAQDAFQTDELTNAFSKRSGSRALGLEGLGKFVTTPIHLLNGVTAFAYNLITVDQFKRTEYFVLVHPGQIEPLQVKRESLKKETQSSDTYVEYQWGKWEAVESLPDLKGCTSAKPGKLTDRQRNWWLRDAQHCGLNPHKEVNNRSFQILPLLKDLRIRL